MTNNFNENDESNEFELDDSSAYSVELPDFRPVSLKKLYNYDQLLIDFEDLTDLNRQITAARVALFKITEQINKYERLSREVKIKYDREYRRAFLRSQEKTESAKRMRAELICEPIENDYLYYDQLSNELNRASYTLRQELQALNSAGNNLRQQLKVI